MIKGSVADRDGRIQKGDRVLSINGKGLKGVTHREALAILKVRAPFEYGAARTRIGHARQKRLASSPAIVMTPNRPTTGQLGRIKRASGRPAARPPSSASSNTSSLLARLSSFIPFACETFLFLSFSPSLFLSFPLDVSVLSGRLISAPDPSNQLRERSAGLVKGVNFYQS